LPNWYTVAKKEHRNVNVVYDGTLAALIEIIVMAVSRTIFQKEERQPLGN
jgi:hypothetical protein